MGTFFHPITIVGPNGEETIEALVDTGASFTTMPASLLRRLGVQPHRRARMRLAGGEVAEWEIGRVTSRLDGMEEADLCIFAPDASPPAIGAHTLQAMLLSVSPVDHRLVPTDGFLL